MEGGRKEGGRAEGRKEEGRERIGRSRRGGEETSCNEFLYAVCWERGRKGERRGRRREEEKREDTSCHKLLHAACWKGGVLWSLQIQIEPVGKLNMSTQLHWVILVLVRNVDQETAKREGRGRQDRWK